MSVKKIFLWNNIKAHMFHICLGHSGGIMETSNTQKQEVIQFQSGQNWSERQIKMLAKQDPKRAMNIVI